MGRTLAEINAQWKEDMAKTTTWTPVTGFSNYEMTFDGRVRNAKSKRVLSVVTYNTHMEGGYYNLFDDYEEKVAVSPRTLIKATFPKSKRNPRSE